MRTLVVTGGSGPSPRHVEPWLAGVENVYACDSGYRLARELGLPVDLVVGDMDSVDRGTLLREVPHGQVMEYPQEKDETDTEIGMRIAFERGAREIVLVGGGGGRLDHLLGILTIFHREPRLVAWISHTAETVQITDTLRRDDLLHQTVSFFPLAGPACTMSTTGLRWPLDKLTWRVGDAGISNVVDERPMTVEMRTGRLVMVRTYVTGASGRGVPDDGG